MLLAACTAPQPQAPVRFHFSVDAADPNTPSAFIVSAAQKIPFRIEVVLYNDTEAYLFERKEYALSHRIPLLGLGADQTWTVQARLIDENDRVIESKPNDIQSPPLPLDFPIIEELVGTPTPLERGFLLFDLKTISESKNYYVLLNADLEVVWWREDRRSCTDIHLQPDGHIFGICNYLATRTSLTGETLLRQPVFDPDGEQEDVNIHHEISNKADGGFLSLHAATIDVDAYPISEEEPEVLEPATIREDWILSIDENLVLEDKWALSDILPTQRIGYDSISRDTTVKPHDWSHSNGVIEDPSDGGVLVSVRHQDALIKLDASGELQWILSAPAGWPEPWQDKLLTGVGDFDYPLHPHAPEIDENGLIWLFDNGNYGNTPYGDLEDARDVYSRVVAYQVDEDNRTFEEVYSFEETQEGLLYSSALGDADWLPHVESVLSVWGRVEKRLADSGPLPTKQNISSHILMHTPGQTTPVMHLKISDCLCDEEVFSNTHRGWKVYRSQWVSDIYLSENTPTPLLNFDPEDPFLSP